MRSAWTFVLPAFSSLATAAASGSSAQVYLYDGLNTKPLPRNAVVDAPSAKLIFSKRIGLSQFESLQDVKEGVIEQLNLFGGNAQDIFGRAQNREHGFIVVSGVADPNIILGSTQARYNTFPINEAPSSAKVLVDNFVHRADVVAGEESAQWQNRYIADEIAQLFAQFVGGDDQWNAVETRGPLAFVSLGELESIGAKYGVKSNYYKDMESKLQQSFDNLIQLAQNENLSLTILFMPPVASRSTKRSEISWGSFARDAREIQQAPELEASGSSQTRLAAFASSTPSKTLDGAPLRGPIPTCFASLDSCQSQTRNCSGHGECIGKYKSTDSRTCFTCACTIPEVRVNPDGSKKTTKFGGAACHKKDVVMPFWLFASFSVVMLTLLSYGIGMLVSMGNEELPSVIGAGVSGPRAK